MWEVPCAGYTRIPVYEKHPQDIIGILYTKDLILVDPGDSQLPLSAQTNSVSFTVRTLARQAARTPKIHRSVSSEHPGICSMQ